MLKLRGKLAFRGHVYFQAVRPDIVLSALTWLTINNPVTVSGNSCNNSKSSGNEIFNITPGENKHPVSFMSDKHCEELEFPVLVFPKGRFGYTAERTVNLSPTKYFNPRR